MGPEKAGKSTLLYSHVVPDGIGKEKLEQMKPTQGFQYEEVRSESEADPKLGLWDLGADEACQ